MNPPVAASLVIGPDAVPAIDGGLTPPCIVGVAALAHRAYGGASLPQLLAALPIPRMGDASEQAAFLLDASFAHELCFEPVTADRMQGAALAGHRLFRVASAFQPHVAPKLRLLALLAPGDLMVNTPLDFITRHLDVQLDLLFVVPGAPLPIVVPEHDVAFFAASDSAPHTLARLTSLYSRWPRPALNDPAASAHLARDEVARRLATVRGCCSPPTLRMDIAELLACAASQTLLEGLGGLPFIIRPVGSHAGRRLQRIDQPAELAAYLDGATATSFFVTAYVDYRDPDGLFRKLRVALIGGRPMVCHMAASEHWMVHYLNAGMAESASRRAAEAEAMAGFESGFATRHAAAFASLHEALGLDYVQIDCAQAPDGRLLVFEVDVAAIIHLLDPPELFDYKQEQMRRVFGAFEAMLRQAQGTFRPALVPEAAWQAVFAGVAA